ncbi:MAG: hypothetical protein QOD73_2402, partial [Solirubrobacteraceae bacterium]|nr:hypothetical protein [Solirubrobacteraceae bacterium]
LRPSWARVSRRGRRSVGSQSGPGYAAHWRVRLGRRARWRPSGRRLGSQPPAAGSRATRRGIARRAMPASPRCGQATSCHCTPQARVACRRVVDGRDAGTCTRSAEGVGRTDEVGDVLPCGLPSTLCPPRDPDLARARSRDGQGGLRLRLAGTVEPRSGLLWRRTTRCDSRLRWAACGCGAQWIGTERPDGARTAEVRNGLRPTHSIDPRFHVLHRAERPPPHGSLAWVP